MKSIISEILFMVIYAPLSLVLSTLHKGKKFQLGVWVRGYEDHKLAGNLLSLIPLRWRIDRLPIVLCCPSLL